MDGRSVALLGQQGEGRAGVGRWGGQGWDVGEGEGGIWVCVEKMGKRERQGFQKKEGEVAYERGGGGARIVARGREKRVQQTGR
jgi:hypothetical protein